MIKTLHNNIKKKHYNNIKTNTLSKKIWGIKEEVEETAWTKKQDKVD